MKNNKLLYALSIGALAVAAGSLIVCLLLLSKQDHLIKKIDEISGQIVQLATVTELDKAQWAENVTPGFNHFHSATFGHFDYPAEWGKPYAKRISFANGMFNHTASLESGIAFKIWEMSGKDIRISNVVDNNHYYVVYQLKRSIIKIVSYNKFHAIKPNRCFFWKFH